MHRGIPGSRRKHSALAFPFVALCTLLGARYHVSSSLVRPLARLLAKQQVANGEQVANACARVGACVFRVLRKRVGSAAYIRPAALEMELVSDMLRPLHFVSGPYCFPPILNVDTILSETLFSFLLFFFSYRVTTTSRVHALSRRHVSHGFD